MAPTNTLSRRPLWARGLQVFTHVAALLPLVLLIWGYARNQLTANPIREITLRTGRTALILLILSLACTPAYIVFRFKPALRLRRPLGLYAFVYAGLHLLIFVGLDFGFDFALIVQEFLERRFIQIGLLAFLILFALAVTSTKRWIGRLGKNWKRLHRLIYPAALLVIVHFIQVVKADVRRPLLYGTAILLLLIVRIPGVRNVFKTVRKR